MSFESFGQNNNETPPAIEVETSPEAMVQEESTRVETTLSKFQGKVGKTIAMGLLSLSMLAAMPKSVEAAEPSARPAATEAVPEAAQAEQETKEIVKDLNETVIARIKKLGMFGKIGLVNQIKKRAGAIRELVNNNRRDVLTQADGALKDILDQYMAVLPEIRERNPILYQATIDGLLDMIRTIETSSLGELKKDPRFN